MLTNAAAEYQSIEASQRRGEGADPFSRRVAEEFDRLGGEGVGCIADKLARYRRSSVRCRASRIRG